MKKLFAIVAVSIILLTGCTKNGEAPQPEKPKPENPSEPTKIPINVATSAWTRATDSAFEQGDKTGIYVVNFNGASAGTLTDSGNHVDNMCFTYSGTWTPATPVYWLDATTKADFYCYYPHAANITNVSAYPFSVKADQSVESNYKASDFLWGKTSGVAPTSNLVQITVKHAMSNLLIYLNAGNGYKDEDLKQAKITICGVKTDAAIDLATGMATATGNAADMTPKAETDHYRALIVPQSVTNSDLIKVSIDGHEYVLKQTIAFEANKQHTCTLTINKTSEGIDIGIGDWETDENDYGGTAE